VRELTYDALQDNVGLRITGRIHHARTIDQKDTLKERDVLPDLGLSWNRSDLADLLAA